MYTYRGIFSVDISKRMCLMRIQGNMTNEEKDRFENDADYRTTCIATLVARVVMTESESGVILCGGEKIFECEGPVGSLGAYYDTELQ